MKRQNTLEMVLAAWMGLGVTIAVFWPGELAADGTKEQTTAKPTLVAGDVAVTVETPEMQPDQVTEGPILRLRATSTGKPGVATIVLAMTSAQVGSEMSRMPVRPMELWRTVQTVEVSTDRPYVKDIPTNAKLPDRSIIRIWIARVSQESAATPATQPSGPVQLQPLGPDALMAATFTTKSSAQKLEVQPQSSR